MTAKRSLDQSKGAGDGFYFSLPRWLSANIIVPEVNLGHCCKVYIQDSQAKKFPWKKPFPFVKYKINRHPTEMDLLPPQPACSAGVAGTEFTPTAQVQVAEKDGFLRMIIDGIKTLLGRGPEK